MKGLLSSTGYRDPTKDCESIVFPVDQPCSVLNLHDDMEALIPFKVWRENWTWSQMKPILEENREHLWHWKGTVTIRKSKPTRFPDQSSPFSSYVKFGGVQGGSLWDPTLWTVSCLYSGYKTEEIWSEDAAIQLNLRKIVDSWAVLTGYQKLLSTRDASTRTGWEVLIEADHKPDLNERPLLYFGLRRGGDHDWLAVPGEENGSISEFYSCGAQHIDSEMAFKLFEAAIFPLFGGDPIPEEISYKPKNEDVPAFREWAVPAFGGPWIQYILGTATDQANPAHITDEVPDWSIYVVGYFKLLRSRRCVILQKEPSGWRLLLTGNTITNPERHRWLREEIAQMAGLTSKTLWEPQEVGEGWLGVPG